VSSASPLWISHSKSRRCLLPLPPYPLDIPRFTQATPNLESQQNGLRARPNLAGDFVSSAIPLWISHPKSRHCLLPPFLVPSRSRSTPSTFLSDLLQIPPWNSLFRFCIQPLSLSLGLVQSLVFFFPPCPAFSGSPPGVHSCPLRTLAF
jgi:hypothetical protein